MAKPMSLEEALVVAEQLSPLPSVAHDAMQVLMAEIERLNGITELRSPQHGDDAGDGMRYVLCKFGFGSHYQDWLLIPHVDGQYVTAAKLPAFSVSILRHALVLPEVPRS